MPADVVSLDELPDLDVRTVAIIWGDGEPRPKVITSENVDEFLAVGLLRAALVALESRIGDYVDVEGLEDDEDEDEDDDDY